MNGRYASEWGVVTLSQGGGQIRGRWVTDSGVRGEVESGWLEGRTLTFRYRWGENSGTAVFALSETAPNTWEGNFRHDSGSLGFWNLKLIAPASATHEVPAPAAVVTSQPPSSIPSATAPSAAQVITRQAQPPRAAAATSSVAATASAGSKPPEPVAPSPAPLSRPPAPAPPAGPAPASSLGGLSLASLPPPSTAGVGTGSAAPAVAGAPAGSTGTAAPDAATSSAAPLPPALSSLQPPAASNVGMETNASPAAGGAVAAGGPTTPAASTGGAPLVNLPPPATASVGTGSPASAGSVATGGTPPGPAAPQVAQPGAPATGTAGPPTTQPRQPPGATAVPRPSKLAAESAARLESAVALGEKWLATQDRKDRAPVSDALETLERTLKDPKRAASCPECAGQLGWVYYYQTRFGMREDFDLLRDHARRKLKENPQDAALLYLLGNAAFMEQDHGQAIAALERFLMLEGTKPEWQAQARTTLEQARKGFLTGWYRQANFYSNPAGSRLIAGLEQGARMATLMQQQSSQVGQLQAQQPGQGRAVPGQQQIDTGAKVTQQVLQQAKQEQEIFVWTPDKEMQLASKALTSATEKTAPVQDPEVEQYVSRLVARLLEKTPTGPPYPYKVEVVANDSINAFALPGHIRVHSGLIRFAENESEFVGVLAHELGHSFGHHMARMYMRQAMTQKVLGLVGAALATKAPTTQMIALTAGQLTSNLLLLAYSRSEEREADLYATHIAYNAGYNPTYLTGLLLRLYKMHPKQPVKLFSRHPADPDRIDYLTDYMQPYPLGREMRIDSEEYQQVRKKLGAAAPRGKGSPQQSTPLLKP